MSVVIGSAIIMPKIPNNAPHIDNDNKMTAGFRPVASPIILGTKIASTITCIIPNVKTIYKI